MKIVKTKLIFEALESDNKITIEAITRKCNCCSHTKHQFRFRVSEYNEETDEHDCYIENILETLNNAFDQMNEFLRSEYAESEYA